jgi:hypothetical protein
MSGSLAEEMRKITGSENPTVRELREKMRESAGKVAKVSESAGIVRKKRKHRNPLNTEEVRKSLWMRLFL